MAVACPNCGATNPDRSDRCAICGADLARRSPAGQPAVPGGSRPPAAGAPTGRPAVPPAPGPASTKKGPAGKQAPTPAMKTPPEAAAPPQAESPVTSKTPIQSKQQEQRLGGVQRPTVQQPATTPQQPATPPQRPQAQPQQPATTPNGVTQPQQRPATSQQPVASGRPIRDEAVATPPAATAPGPEGKRASTAPAGAVSDAGPAGEEKAGQATREIGAPETTEGETGTWPESGRWPYSDAQAYGWPPYGGMQAYGGTQGGYPPWYPPHPVLGYPSPFMGMYFWPYWMPYFMPPYSMMPYPYGLPAQTPYPTYPAQQQPYPAYTAQQQPYVGGARRRRTRPLYVVLIIIGLLIVAGGAVAAVLLLTGKTSATYRLGDGSVTGADIEFREMVLKQNGGTLVLTGTYDNNTKNKGTVVVTIQGISKGSEQLLSFNVPVVAGTGKTFSQQKPSSSVKLSGATLSSLVYKGSTETSPSDNSYPWSSTPQQSTPSQTGSQPSYPSSLPNSSSTNDELNPYESLPIPEDYFQTSPQISLPVQIY